MVERFNSLIEEAGRRYNVDPELIRAVMRVESSGRPEAVGPEPAIGTGRARGLMQLMPDTARALGVTDPHDPRQAIFAGARLLAENLDRYGDPALAVLAYHGGTDQRNWGPRTQQHLVRVADNFRPQARTDVAQAVVPQAPTQASPARGVEPVAARESQLSNDPILDFLMGAPRASAPQSPPPSGASRAQTMDPVDQFLGGVVNSETQVPNPTTGEIPPPRRQTSFNERANAGFARGIRDVADAPAAWMSGVAERSGLTSALRNSALGRFLESSGIPITTEAQTREGNTEARANFNREFGDSGAALAGRVVGNVAGTLGPLATGGALLRGAGTVAGAAMPAATAARLTPAAQALAGTATPANPLLRFGARAVTGATAGAAGTALTLDPDQDTANQLMLGAGLGAGANAALVPLARSGMNNVRQFFVPGTSPEVTALAQRAEQLGVPVRGSQISESPFIRWLDETLNMIPGSGQLGRNQEQRAAFTRAVSRSIGENTDTITADVLQAAERRIGNAMNDVARRTSLSPDNQFVDRLAEIEQELTRAVLPEGAARALRAQLNDVFEAFSQSNVPGEVYQRFTRFGTPLYNATKSADPNIRSVAGQVREALDDLLERNATPELIDQLRTARSQWRAMVNVVEPLAERAPNGQMDPAALLTRIRTAYPDFLRRGTGANELGDLALIGAQFMPRMPNSGTAQRVLIGSGLANMGAYMMDPGMLAYGLGTSAAAAGGSRMIGSALASDAYRNMLLGRGVPGAIGRTVDNLSAGSNRLLDATGVPAVVSIGRQDWFNTGEEQPIVPNSPADERRTR